MNNSLIIKVCLSVIISVLLIYCCSCDILRFNNDHFKVSLWSPDQGFYRDTEDLNIWLVFSNEPDKASVERNFTLSADGTRVKGNISWEGKKILFTPLSPFELNKDYSINLTKDAHDINGYSMDEDFLFEFTTRENNARPVLLSYYPEKYEIIDNPKAEIRLEFSNPISITSLYGNFTISPSMSGSWSQENNGTIAVFTPSESWTHNKRYEIRYTSSLTNIYGISIDSEFSGVFTVGTDTQEPFLLSAMRITKEGNCINLDENLINEGWEKEDKLKLIFSEPIDGINLKNYLSLAPELSNYVPSFVPENNHLETENSSNRKTGFSDEFIFKFESVPAFESQFRIHIKPGIRDEKGNESINEYIFKISANGQYSKPPSLAGFRMPMDPQDAVHNLFTTDPEEVYQIITLSDDHYPSSVPVRTWMELYFDAVTDINTLSLMELFRVETSNLVINFSPRIIKNENFSAPDPHSGWENYQRIEIEGILTNSTNYGVIFVQIGSGLADNFGNKNEKPQRILIIK